VLRDLKRRAGDLRRRLDQFQLALPLFEPAVLPTPGDAPVPESILDALWNEHAPIWSARWGVPDLRAEVRLELSHRMRSSLGGFYARERVIRIADTLLEAPAHLLHEVLCHEAAHAAVEILHGDRARSHGREWRELMRRVGIEPRVHVPGADLGRASQRAARKRWVWRHRCPHCRAERLAGRPVRQWRCRPCTAAGRDGKLVVTRIAARAVRAPRPAFTGQTSEAAR
jgi:predicted SprT family Zn-dependent metalloprotease